MAIPTGEIVDRPMLARSCGCIQEFQVFKVDKYLAQRRAKFQSTRCPACVAKYFQEQRATLPPKKGEAFALLPAGAQMTLTRRADGSWLLRGDRVVPHPADRCDQHCRAADRLDVQKEDSIRGDSCGRRCNRRLSFFHSAGVVVRIADGIRIAREDVA